MPDLVESFVSLSGEAPLPGIPVFLIRFSGCNLSCRYCDTPYREERNFHLSVEELKKLIREQMDSYPGLKVLLTGGEPLWGERQEEIFTLIKRMPEVDFYIETNGTIKIEEFSLKNSHLVVDWKIASSGAQLPFCRENLKSLSPERDCIKIVMGPEDKQEVKEIIGFIKKENPGLPVYLSPRFEDLPLEDLARFILDNRLPAAMSIQLHKYIWKADKRGV